MKKGRYFHSLKEYVNAGGNESVIKNCPSISVTGSVEGMRRDFWGYKCDVVRIGNWVYKVN